jgi:peptidoglycan hydrolase-like protein with peptidoglycan-binding domain
VTPGRRTSIALAALAFGGALAPATAQAKRHPKPQLARLRCVPAKSAACRAGVTVQIGRQIQLSGTRLTKGMRVAFRWSQGALATKLDHTRVGYVARIPAGTRAGAVSVTVSDRAGRRSNAKRMTVAPVPGFSGPAPARGALPQQFAGSGMWIWELSKSEGGDIAAIAAKAHAYGVSTVFVKSSDGPGNRWAQFSPELVAALHANGLRACAWQYVYGADPLGEANLGADAVHAGADCLVIDAEGEYEGRYAAAQQYVGALRAAIGPAYPLGFTSFPYVDYHARLPYSVFLGPNGAQANLPQVYWKAIGGTVDAVSAHTLAHNRIYGTAIAPLGQSYDNAPPEDIVRFRGIWAAYGAGGVSWWSWQSTGDPQWAATGPGPVAPIPLPDPGWPALAKGNKGDEVVWLQQHLASHDPTVAVTSTFDAATDAAVRRLQAERGLEVSGVTDPATWGAVLSFPLQPVDWTARG